MNTQTLSVHALLEILEDATKETAETALDLVPVGRTGLGDEMATEFSGAYISLTGAGLSCQMGIASDPDGCRALASALMMLEPDDDPLQEEDIADAVGEVANLLLGVVKTRLYDIDPDTPVSMGTPLHLNGKIRPLAGQELLVSEYKLGPTTVELTVICNQD